MKKLQSKPIYIGAILLAIGLAIGLKFPKITESAREGFGVGWREGFESIRVKKDKRKLG